MDVQTTTRRERLRALAARRTMHLPPQANGERYATRHKPTHIPYSHAWTGLAWNKGAV